MKCSAFIATSADGYIATPEGDIGWLERAGREGVDLGDEADMGFNDYLSSIDCMVMGRKSMQKISSFDLPPEHWPYADRPIFVISRSLTEVPENLADRVELHNGEMLELIEELEEQGFEHACIDGGVTITSCLELGLLDEITITRAPLLLGDGIPLFGRLASAVRLEQPEVITFANDFIQVCYQVSYP